MLGKTTNPLLQKTEQGIEAKVPANLKAAFERTVTAGLTIMYSPQSHQIMMQQLSKPGDALQNLGEGVAKLVGKLYQQSNHTMPSSVAAPVSIVLMCEGLDFLSQAGKVQITPDTIDQATQDTSAFVLQLFGVSPDKLSEIMAAKSQKQAPAQPAAKGIISGAIGGQ